MASGAPKQSRAGHNHPEQREEAKRRHADRKQKARDRRERKAAVRCLKATERLGDPHAVAAAFDELPKSLRKNPKVLMAQAAALTKLEQFDAAGDRLAELLARDPLHAQAWARAGRLLSKR